jgi:eukaryotic-like serine/threonine-protein kinase
MANNTPNESNEDRSFETDTDLTKPVPPTVMAHGLNAQHLEQTVNYWSPGKILEDGRYTIAQKLGSGGFGITYLAQDNRSGDRVVIKTLSTEYIPSDRFERFRKDFLNEAVRLAKCSHHRHVVRIIGLIEEEGLPCIVMDYIPGPDLETIAKQKTLSQEQALRYIRQIGEALTAVHQQGLLHRDVKPKNIIIRADTDEAVLIDFGIAREYNPNADKSLTAFMSGGYTPIEQIYPDDRENKPGFYTDVYGLAATFYYLVTCRNPEDAQTRAFQMNGNRADPLVNPRQIAPEISALIDRAICQGMALYPENRPQTIQEWLTLLSSFSEEPDANRTLKVDATKIQTKERTQPSNRPFNRRNENRKSQRNLIWIISGSLGAIALSIVAVIAIQKLQNSPAQFGSNSDSTVELNPQDVSQYYQHGIELNYPKDWTVKEYEPNEFTQIVAELTPPDGDAAEPINPKIYVEIRQVDRATTIATAAKQATEEIKKYLPGANVIDSREVKLNTHLAYSLVYTGLDGQNPLKRMQVGVLKDNQLYILTYEAKSDRYQQYEPTVKAIIESFQFSSR